MSRSGKVCVCARSHCARRPFPPEYVGLGYAYILTHPGMPCIFYDHMYTWGDGYVPG